METDPPADDLAAAIFHGDEVAGLNNDGGEASGEEASLPKPQPKRIYNTVGFRK